MLAVAIFLALIALLWLWLLFSPAHRATFTDLLNSTTTLPTPARPWPAVTVIVAARNEAEMLPQTMPTICRQNYPDLRVLLVDDQSDDNSAGVIANLTAQHANLTAIRAADRPAGWMGKCWAIQQGIDHLKAADAARLANDSQPSSLLLFTDADILHHPQAIRQAASFLIDRKLDMISLMPRCICATPIERLGVGGLMTLLALMFPNGWANDHEKKWAALACGAFILIRPEAYAKVGGHGCVRGSMIEDVNLARALKRSGARVAVHNTRDLISTRMYESFSDLWEGLTKNAYAGMEYQPRKFWVGLPISAIVSVFPPIYFLLTFAWALHSKLPLAWAACGLATVINLCIIVIHRRTTRHLNFPAWYGLTLPVSSALYNLIAIDSVFQHHFRGGNAWKGRRYNREMLLNQSLDDNGESNQQAEHIGV